VFFKDFSTKDQRISLFLIILHICHSQSFSSCNSPWSLNENPWQNNTESHRESYLQTYFIKVFHLLTLQTDKFSQHSIFCYVTRT